MNHNSSLKTQVSGLPSPVSNLTGLSAVIPIGLADFGRYPLRSRLPQALWPLGNRSILQRLIEGLAGQGIRQVFVCVGGDTADIESSIMAPEGVELVTLSQGHARGSGGCLFDAAQKTDDERLLLCQSNLLRVPDLSGLIAAHQEAGADVTMATCPDGPAGDKGSDWADGGLAPLVLCNRSILETIPAEGYCDLSEGLLPQLIRTGKVVHSIRLDEPVGSFHGWRQYLAAAGGLLQLTPGIKPGASKDCLSRNDNGPDGVGPSKDGSRTAPAILDSGLRRNDNQHFLSTCSPLTADLSLLPSASCLLPDVSPIPDRPGVWAGREVRIHPTAKILGPVVLSDRVQVAEKCVIIGPFIFGTGIVSWGGQRSIRKRNLGCCADWAGLPDC
jgi:hypothetical protein